MVNRHNGHGAALPMSGPEWPGTPIPYRVVGWAAQQLDMAREALRTIRERTPEDFYPLDLLFGGCPEALVNEGLLVVVARRLTKAAEYLTEASAELDFVTLATLRAETAPPLLPKADPSGRHNGPCLAIAEKALDGGGGPGLLDDRAVPPWLRDLVRACRVAAAALVASGYIDADCEVVETAVSRLAGVCA
jgi:hypothetical protein